MIRDWVKQIRAYLEPNFHVTRLKEFRSAENLYQGIFLDIAENRIGGWE